MKIASKQKGVKIRSANPSFNYRFREADVPIDVPEEHAKKILRNPTFYKWDKKSTEPTKLNTSNPSK